MKRCPYCAEFVKVEAIVCRYCGKDLVDPKYEYKVFHTDHVWTCWWCIPDNYPAHRRPSEDAIRRISWEQNGETDVRNKLTTEFAQGWIADYVGPEGLILEERHETSKVPGTDYDSYTTYRIGYECQLKRPKQARTKMARKQAGARQIKRRTESRQARKKQARRS